MEGGLGLEDLSGAFQPKPFCDRLCFFKVYVGKKCIYLLIRMHAHIQKLSREHMCRNDFEVSSFEVSPLSLTSEPNLNVTECHSAAVGVWMCQE